MMYNNHEMIKATSIRIYPILALVVVILCINSCGDTSTYNTFTMEEGQARFSFEYSSAFQLVEYSVSDKYHLAGVTLTGPIQKEIMDYPSIEVIVNFEPDEYSPDAETTLETWLTKASKSSSFELWEKSEIVVDNITAKQAIYSETNILPIDRGGEEPPGEIWRRVHFDYNGMIWTITLNSNYYTYETDNEIFEHVLQTFQILN
jgi:hypothetical protein